MAHGISKVNGATIAVGPEGTDLFRLLALKTALHMEIQQQAKYGHVVMRTTRGIMASTRVRRDLGIYGNRVDQMAKLEAHIQTLYPVPVLLSV